MLQNYIGTRELWCSARVAQQEQTPAGCSKRPSSKTAASEDPRRTLGVRWGSERCENAAVGFFQHPARNHNERTLACQGRQG